MKLSGYFVLAVIAVSVVFGKKSDYNNLALETISFIQNSSKVNLDSDVYPNATVCLESGYKNGTKCVAESEDIITNAISKAKDLVLQDPDGAKKLLQQAFQDARMVLFTYAIPTVIAYGSALELSNQGALGGLNNASRSVQRAGFSALEGLNAAEILFVAGIGAGGSSSQVLLDACQLAVEAGYAGSYNNLKIAIQEADQALRDAKSNPIEGQIKNQSCESTANDPLSLQAIHDINEAASNASQNGANADLIELVKNALICGIESYANLTSQGVIAVEGMKPMAKSDPLALKNAYAKLVVDYTLKIEDLFSRMYVVIGGVAFKAGVQLNNRIEAAIMAIVEGQAQVGMGVQTGQNLVDLGLKYGGDGPVIAIDSVVNLAAFLQIDLTQQLVKSAKLVFSAL